MLIILFIMAQWELDFSGRAKQSSSASGVWRKGDLENDNNKRVLTPIIIIRNTSNPSVPATCWMRVMRQTEVKSTPSKILGLPKIGE